MWVGHSFEKCDISAVAKGTVVDVCVFFFSSRRRHTRFDCDWSSDVCSSDLSFQPLEILRRYFEKFDVPLRLAMEGFRKSNDLERGTNPYSWKDILMEELLL